MGLRTDSVVIADNLATVHDQEIDRVIGVCPVIELISAALRHTLGL